MSKRHEISDSDWERIKNKLPLENRGKEDLPNQIA